MTYWFRFKRPEAKLYVYLTPFKTTPTIHGRVEEGRAGGMQNDMRFMSADKTFSVFAWRPGRTDAAARISAAA